MSFEDHVRVIEARFTCKLPTDYIHFLQANGPVDRDFEKDWLKLFPIENVVDHSESGDLQHRCPGAIAIGGDGSREMLTFDTRQSTPPLVLIDVAAASWADAFFQAPLFAAFMASFPRVGWRFD